MSLPRSRRVILIAPHGYTPRDALNRLSAIAIALDLLVAASPQVAG
jgi:hypothetical protein